MWVYLDQCGHVYDDATRCACTRVTKDTANLRSYTGMVTSNPKRWLVR